MSIIENPAPDTWQALQEGVARIFQDVGLAAITNHSVKTARGTVELDVYAVDMGSVDEIRYAVECKNWNTAIPQSVVHAFCTVMSEVGANIGYIVSKLGLQSGAVEYTRFTNVSGHTYAEFQERYRRPWLQRHFLPSIASAAGPLIEYVEPINCRRDRFLAALSEPGRARYAELNRVYGAFGMAMVMLPAHPGFSPINAATFPDVPTLCETLDATFDGSVHFKAVHYRDLLSEILTKVNEVTRDFDEAFGQRVFEYGPTKGA